MADICAAAAAPIVPIFEASIGDVEQLCVDARTLHTLLKSGNTFCHWFNARVQKYQLRAGQDFELIGESVNDAETSRIGRPPKDYRFSLETAKALSLSENTAHAQSIWRQLIAWQRSMQPQHVDTAGDYTRISTSQAQTLKELVNTRVKETALHHQTVWTAFQHRFRVNSYLELPASKFDDACAYLRDYSSIKRTENLKVDEVTSWENDVQESIRRRAWDLAAETLPVFQNFLERYVSEHTDASSRQIPRYVTALLEQLKLDYCLSQRYAWKLHQALNIVYDTERRTAELFAELETRLLMLEKPSLVTTSLPRT